MNEESVMVKTKRLEVLEELAWLFSPLGRKTIYAPQGA